MKIPRETLGPVDLKATTAWMRTIRPKLNPDKMDVVWVGSFPELEGLLGRVALCVTQHHSWVESSTGSKCGCFLPAKTLAEQVLNMIDLTTITHSPTWVIVMLSVLGCFENNLEIFHSYQKQLRGCSLELEREHLSTSLLNIFAGFHSFQAQFKEKVI